MMTVMGRAKAACGSATPHHELSSVSCRMRMNSGRMATAAGKSSPSTNSV